MAVALGVSLIIIDLCLRTRWTPRFVIIWLSARRVIVPVSAIGWCSWKHRAASASRLTAFVLLLANVQSRRAIETKCEQIKREEILHFARRTRSQYRRSIDSLTHCASRSISHYIYTNNTRIFISHIFIYYTDDESVTSCQETSVIGYTNFNMWTEYHAENASDLIYPIIKQLRLDSYDFYRAVVVMHKASSRDAVANTRIGCYSVQRVGLHNRPSQYGQAKNRLDFFVWLILDWNIEPAVAFPTLSETLFCHLLIKLTFIQRFTLKPLGPIRNIIMAQGGLLIFIVRVGLRNLVSLLQHP